jgi:threonine dehydrogenase-like Zn-dependent dehydrogenase
MTTTRALGITRPGVAGWLDVDELPLADGRFRVQTLFSGLSAGTELTYFKGTNPYLEASWDADWGVFRRDRPAQSYPVTRLGYMEVGRVTEARTDTLAVGDVVAMAFGHKESHVAEADQERFVVLPDGFDPLLGIYVAHMGPICANGILHAAAELAGRDVRLLGDGVRGLTVLVTGAGVVGLLVALFARHLGAANVVVADQTPQRLEAAHGLGLETIDQRDGELWEHIKRRWRHGAGDRGADVVFQCRGRITALTEALRCLRPQGTLIDLAFYQDGAADTLRLGEEFHHNGLGIRCAQIGRVPRGLGHLWDRDRLSRETIGLLEAHADVIRSHLISDIVPFADAPQLLQDVATRRRHVIQAVFAM